jgi:hypothetical protein
MKLILLALLLSLNASPAPLQPALAAQARQIQSDNDKEPAWCAIGYWILRWFYGPSRSPRRRSDYPVKRPLEKVRVTVVTATPVTTFILAFNPA